MRIGSWLKNALRAFKERRAYRGHHRLNTALPRWAHQTGLPGQTVIPPWPTEDYADALWGEALKRMAYRRQHAVLQPA